MTDTTDNVVTTRKDGKTVVSKRTRTPRGFDSIMNGAKSLPLKDRVELVKELTNFNEGEVAEIERKAQEGRELLKA